MYYSVYIPEDANVEAMNVAELYSKQSYYYYNPPSNFEEQKEAKLISERLSYIQNQSHT